MEEAKHTSPTDCSTEKRVLFTEFRRGWALRVLHDGRAYGARADRGRMTLWVANDAYAHPDDALAELCQLLDAYDAARGLIPPAAGDVPFSALLERFDVRVGDREARR